MRSSAIASFAAGWSCSKHPLGLAASVMPRLVTDEENAASKSRLVGIRLASLVLRIRTGWSGLFGDADTAAIALAIVAIVSERLLRQELDPQLESLEVQMPVEALGCCNLSSISAASGVNRETVRRHINRLVKEGVVVREGASIRLTPGFTQKQEVIDLVRAQLEEVRRTADELLRAGVIAIAD